MKQYEVRNDRMETVVYDTDFDRALGRAMRESIQSKTPTGYTVEETQPGAHRLIIAEVLAGRMYIREDYLV